MRCFQLGGGRLALFKLWMVFGIAACVALFGQCVLFAGEAPSGTATNQNALAIIVMDPLARELACECVKGHAQRDYPQLAGYLSRKLGQPATFLFSESLADALAKVQKSQETLVIGKQSVIGHDAGPAGLKGRPICRLTGKDGATTLTGLFVVKASDTAKKLEDLAGRSLFLGLPNADEKHAAALAALRAAGVTPPDKFETRAACAGAALDVIDSKLNPPPVGVISSYALPLLEGCGSVQKGELKVIGHTAPVPFIIVYACDTIASPKQERILQALLAVKNDPALLAAMESKNGFVPMESSGDGQASDWPGWRGASRDGHVAALPDKLPAAPRVVWSKPVINGGLAGIVATQGRVLVADRNSADEEDVFRCLRDADGELLWRYAYAANGELDYGRFPRAAPTVCQSNVYCLGAFGDLACLSLETGALLWKKHLVKDLQGSLPNWGYCSSPLVVDKLIIVNPGGSNSALVALDRLTGQIQWKTPGNPAAYSSFIFGKFGNRDQIVGYDAKSLGGWDPATGKRLWTLQPKLQDFNVPTPIAINGKLFVMTENNGARLYDFDNNGVMISRPVAEFAGMASDTISPIASGGHVFGCNRGLYSLGLDNALKPEWFAQDDAFYNHVSLIADNQRVLAVSAAGEAVLFRAAAPRFEAISRLQLTQDNGESYAYPAYADGRLYYRSAKKLACLDLTEIVP